MHGDAETTELFFDYFSSLVLPALLTKRLPFPQSRPLPDFANPTPVRYQTKRIHTLRDEGEGHSSEK
jgi:hypothetical protein